MATSGGNHGASRRRPPAARPALSALTRLAGAALLAGALLPACGGGSGATLVVGTRTFVLQGGDAALAKEFDAYDITIPSAPERCAFWRNDAPKLAVERSAHWAGNPSPARLLEYVGARSRYFCEASDKASEEARAQQRKALEATCAGRFPEALAAAQAALAKYKEEQRAREAAGRAAPREAMTPRSDLAMRQWVGAHISIKKLPCTPAGSDYLIGLQVTNRAKSPLACEFGGVPVGQGGAVPAVRKNVSVAVDQTERLEVPVRTCASTGAGSQGGIKLVLTCRLSEANRAEAGIDDPRLSWFGYDVDSLELTSEVAAKESAKGAAPPPPVPERARFIAECVAAQIP